MVFAIAGICAAALSAVVALIGSIRSTPLLTDAQLVRRNFLVALAQQVQRQQELYEQLTRTSIDVPTSVACLQNAAQSCSILRERIDKDVKILFNGAVSASASRAWQLGAGALAFVSVACQVAALVAK